MYILHQNIAGLINKTDELIICLAELSDKGSQVDVICITEHFMKFGYEQLLDIPNYKLASSFSRKDSSRGGAAIIIRKGYRWKELEEVKHLSIPCVCEMCAIELIDCGVLIVCIYRVPNRNSNNIDTFLNKLDSLLAKLCKKNNDKRIIIAGDFNIDILKNNNITLEFECVLLNYNLRLEIRQPTRLISMTCLDNFAHNIQKGQSATVIDFGLSDHTAQLYKVPIKRVYVLSQWRVKKRDLSMENMIKFKNCLQSLNFYYIYENNNPNVVYNNFMEDFTLFYNLCFPYKTVYIKATKQNKWLSKNIRKCSRKKRSLLWIYRRQPSHANKLTYKKYSGLLRNIIRKSKRLVNRYKILTADNKSKVTWQIINGSNGKSPLETTSRISIDDKVITHPEEICNTFNNFFVDKIKPIPERDSCVTKNIKRVTSSMFMAPCLPNDIINIIKSLKNSNSVGHDEICTKVIKFVCAEISSHLCRILNLCLSKGIYPDQLKTAIVKPLHKKGNREHLENYRPIALTPIISKIFEKFIACEIHKYLEKFKILVEEQKGFRRNKNINMAIYDFLKQVIVNVDRRTPVCSVYCDMTQAFDYVDHNILIKKLEAYGIRGNILELLSTYLSNRKQVTVVSKMDIRKKTQIEYKSKERTITYGVPQGSVLGPLLFILYINDLPTATSQHMSLFADDSTITVKCNKTAQFGSDINEAIKSVVKWLKNNNLKINLDKTNVMHFNQRSIITNLSTTYEDKIIGKVNEARYLGLVIDSRLNWKPQIQEVCKKLSSASYALYKLAGVMDTNALLTAYHGIVASRLRYGVIFWGNSTDRDLVFRAQKRCLRSIFGLSRTDSCKPYFIKHKLLTFPCMYIVESALFVKNNPNLFEKITVMCNRNRRDNDEVYIPRANTALMHKGVICMAPRIYNHIPKKIRCSNSLLFKKKLTEFLLINCFYNLTEFFEFKDQT